MTTSRFRPAPAALAAALLLSACTPPWGLAGNADEVDRGSSDSATPAVIGTVHDMNGDPVGSAGLTTELKEGTVPPMSDVGYGTAEDGSYRIPLPPATWEIQAHKGDLSTVPETVLLEDGTVTVDLHFAEPLPAE